MEKTSEDAGINGDVPKNVPKSFEERKRLIIERIQDNVSITKRDLAKEFRVDAKTIQRDFDRLKDRIRFVGSKKGGRWEII